MIGSTTPADFSLSCIQTVTRIATGININRGHNLPILKCGIRLPTRNKIPTPMIMAPNTTIPILNSGSFLFSIINLHDIGKLKQLYSNIFLTYGQSEKFPLSCETFLYGWLPVNIVFFVEKNLKLKYNVDEKWDFLGKMRKNKRISSESISVSYEEYFKSCWY